MLKKKCSLSALILVYGFFVLPFEVSGNILSSFPISHRITRIVSFKSICNFEKKKAIVNERTSSSENSVQFVLYNKLVPEGIDVEDPVLLEASVFEINEPVKFVTHGWLSGGDLEMSQTIKNAYANNSKVNVFIVDWRKIASNVFYPCVLLKIEEVADLFSEFLEKTIETFQVDPKDIHLIGHSLGAHISGIVGKNLVEKHITIGRITGLDPAILGFQDLNGLKKLSPADAEFVDVIHTCAGALGLSEAIGHVDFYPNGGSAPMPGCRHLFVGDVCSHSRSWQYFAESISNPFISVKCDTWKSFQNGNCSDEFIVLWDYTPKEARGNYFFDTSEQAPFSLGIAGLR